MVNFVRRLKAKMKRTMMLILKRLPFHFPEHRINDLPEPRYVFAYHSIFIYLPTLLNL